MRATTMYDRLSSITQRIPGMKMHQMGSGGFFISTDMFYIEVLMDTSRVKVVEVKVAHNSEPSPCPVLTQVLFNNDLETFARHLEGFASIYQLNTDKKQKSRAYTALTALETDLSKLANVQSTSINSCYNMLHRSPVGVLEPRKGGLPVKMTYFISPYDLVDVSRKEMVNLTISNIMDKNLGLSVTVGIEGSNTTHTLQTTTLMSIRESRDGKSLPLSAPHVTGNSASLPAYFVMKLSKPMPISMSIISEIDQHIKIQQFSANLTQESLINLIARQQLDSTNTTTDEGLDFRKSVFCAKFLDQHHIYHVSGPHVDKFTGAMVTKIPFTHPTNIPSILKLLRQQALFNFIIGSCIRECRPLDLPLPSDENHKDVQILDVNPISLTSICITFEHPSKESLATLEIDLGDINRDDIRCQLHALNMGTVCSDEFASKILQKCWSIPITMKSVIKKCLEKTEHLQQEIERKKEREELQLYILKDGSQQVYQNPLTQSGRDSSNPYFFDSVHGEILTDNLLFPQSNAISTQNSISAGTSSASFLAGLTDNLHRSNSSNSDVCNLNQSQYLKKFVCQPKAKTDIQPSINNLRLSGLPNKTNFQSQTNIKLEGNAPIKKTSVSKQSNTMLMSMLSDIPAANTQSNQFIQCNRPTGQNSCNQRNLNLNRPLQSQSITNKQSPCHGQFPSTGILNQKQPNDVETGVVEKQKKTRKRKSGMDAEGVNQAFGPRSPKSRKASDETPSNAVSIENSQSGVTKSTLPNIILPGRVDIKLKNDQSRQNNPTISYISTQQNNPSKFSTIQESPGSNLSTIIQRRDNFEIDSIKKEKKRKRAESTDNTKLASSTTPSSSSIGCQSSGSNTKVNASGSQAQIKTGAQTNSGNAAKPRKSSINAVVDRLVGAVIQGPSTSSEGQGVGTSPSSSSSSGDSSKPNTDHLIAGQNRVDSSTKVGPSSTSSAKASKYSRAPADQFAIKQGSSGLKLTVTKTKPATPPSSSVPENVSKILNLGTTSSIKYTIPKLSKTQQAAQSSNSNLATSSDQGSSQTSSSDGNSTTVASILASTSTTSLPSSTTVGGTARKNPAMSFRATGPGSMVRNPVSSSTHPANKSLLSSQTTVNTLLNRPSSSVQPDSINLQRISSSSNVGHPQQMLVQQGNRQNPRFNVPTPLGQNRFVTTIITPNATPQFPSNSSNVMANQPEITTYAPVQSNINVRPTNKFMSTSTTDANNITSSRSHISNHQSNLSSTSSMINFTPRAGVDSTQTSAIPRPPPGVSGPVQFYIRQSAFEETTPTSQTLPLTDHINAPRMVMSTISHPNIRDELDSAMKSNISTFSMMPKPLGRSQEGFNNDIVDQSSQDDKSICNMKLASIDDKMIESPVRTASGVTSSSDVPKSAISSTPSSPADCHQQIEVLPPPPLIPIDSLDDDQPPRDSIASSDNDASDRLSIVDINENVADSISSAGTPRPYSINEMTSPAGPEQSIQPSMTGDQPSYVSGSEQAFSAKNHDDGEVDGEGTSEIVDHSNQLDKPEVETSRDLVSCFLNEVQDEKSQVPDDAYSMQHQVVDSAQEDSEYSSTTNQEQSEFPEKTRGTDTNTESSVSKTALSSSNEPTRTSDIQTHNKTLNALRGISSYNADSEGTSSSTEGTPTNKSPDQELDNDFCKVPNIINSDVSASAIQVDSFSATPSTTESCITYSRGTDQFDNFSAERFLENQQMPLPNQYGHSSEAQSASREPNNLSEPPVTNTIKDLADENLTMSSIVSTQSNNGPMDEISQIVNETSNQGITSNSDSNTISTNESNANVISAQSPSSV